jgi:hypothetical protein
VDAHHSASLSSSNYTRTAATTMQQPHRHAKTDSEATFSMAAYYVQSPGHDDKTAAQGRLYIFEGPGRKSLLGPYTNINYIQIFYIYQSFIKNSTKILKLI